MDKHLIIRVLLKHLLNSHSVSFDTMKVGEIISRVNDAVKIRTFINDVRIQIFSIYSSLSFLVFNVLPITGNWH